MTKFVFVEGKFVALEKDPSMVKTWGNKQFNLFLTFPLQISFTPQVIVVGTQTATTDYIFS